MTKNQDLIDVGYIKGEVFNISLLELKVPGMIDCLDTSQGKMA